MSGAPPHWRRPASAGLRIALLAVACWALRRELAGVRAADIVSRVLEYGLAHVALGLACTLGSFALLGAIEVLALRQTQRMASATSMRVPTATVLATAFVANAFSQSIGLALLTGAAVRLRAYARYSIDAAGVARVTGFATLSTTLGLLAAGSVALLASSPLVRLRGAALPGRPAGILLAALVGGYLAWSAIGRPAAIGHGRWSLSRSPLPIAMTQVGLSAVDWLLTGTVLYAFLPDALGIGYWSLLRAYMIAQIAGVTSHVPGGAGVLEVVLLALLADAVPTGGRAALVASLAMFRVMLYLLPLLAALLVAGIAESRRFRLRVTTRPASSHVQ